MDKLDVEVVDVGHGLDGNGAGVTLRRMSVICLGDTATCNTRYAI